MRILLIYKLVTKQIGIKNQSKRCKQPQNQEKTIQKYVQKWYMTLPT